MKKLRDKVLLQRVIVDLDNLNNRFKSLDVQYRSEFMDGLLYGLGQSIAYCAIFIVTIPLVSFAVFFLFTYYFTVGECLYAPYFNDFTMSDCLDI